MVPQWLMVPFTLCLTFITCAAISWLFCLAARKLFPWFRSGEFKPGMHRSDLRTDLPASGREIKTIELPLVGGPALIIALLLTGITVGFLLKFTTDQWILLLIGLGTTLGYAVVGFIDDWHKVFSKEGLSERQKFTGLLAVSIVAALLYFFLLDSSRQAYTPYMDLPILSSILCPIPHINQSACQTPGHHAIPFIFHPWQPAYYIWLMMLVLITSIIGTLTSLSVDFSDGLDGLAGGLVFSASLAFGIIITGNLSHPEGVVLEVMSLLTAGSVLGYLPWNWPSAWAARRGTAKRLAKIYMGDSGALGLGGVLAMIAIFSRQEILLLMIGGAFVLEGLSALIQGRVLTRRLFRRQLLMLRFASSDHKNVPHTEFPLPFLATPLHHHFDLIGWDRRRLVYGAWALGACFATLGVMVGLAPETWERYLGRILVLILAWLVWSSGSWTRRYFVGKYPAERTRRRRLALYYGFPYQLMGIRLYHRVEIIEASEDVIETPAEELALWQRMNIFDARAMLGLYCYRAGYYPAALVQWTRIPASNRAFRPEIDRLLIEVENRLAVEKQETQPMRRDQIMRQPPLISGNLPPADLPNPHEPIRSEETMDGRGNWATSSSSSHFDVDDSDDEERQVTSPLHSDAVSLPTTNGNASSNGHVDAYRSATVQRSWLMRLLHLTPHKSV
jgi:UDP-N-acetylmuramyl pentapeptide phosphotransferase/UDP-N-acetylglucosamine-1-phosphate transferase